MFTRPQQGHFRPLVQRAWVASRPADPKDKEARREWYAHELAQATGHASSSDCDPKGDFEKAMAHFEALIGDSIYWQMRLFSGNTRRIIHEIQQEAADFDCDENYLRGIARQSLRLSPLDPLDLHTLSAEHLLTILRALRIQLRRQIRRGQPTDHPRHAEEAEPCWDV